MDHGPSITGRLGPDPKLSPFGPAPAPEGSESQHLTGLTSDSTPSWGTAQKLDCAEQQRSSYGFEGMEATQATSVLCSPDTRQRSAASHSC